MNRSFIQFEDCTFDYGSFELYVRSLAAPPRVQAKLYPPFADITFELVDDFDHSTNYDGFTEYSKIIPTSQLAAIRALKNVVENLEDPDCEWTPDDIEDVLQRPAWRKIRERAQELLDVLDVRLGEVSKCVETAPGHWSRDMRCQAEIDNGLSADFA